MDLVSRLKKYIDHTGLPVTQFADTCSIPRPTMSQLLSGRNKKVSNELIAKLHDAFPQLNVLWLMFGQGSMLVNENIAATEPQNASFEDHNHSQEPEIEAIAGGVLNFDHDKKISSDNFRAPASPHPATLESDHFVSGPSPLTSTPLTSAGSQQPSIRQAKRSPAVTQASHPLQPTSRTETAPGCDASEKPAYIPVDAAKRVVNIIVYYSDNSFQSFVPDNKPAGVEI